MTEEKFNALLGFLRRIGAINGEGPVLELLCRKSFMELSDMAAALAAQNDTSTAPRVLSRSPVPDRRIGGAVSSRQPHGDFAALTTRTLTVDQHLFDWLFGDIREGESDDYVAGVRGDGRIFMVKGRSHPDLNAVLQERGLGVRVAGEISRPDEEIYQISNKSGHLRPDDESLLLLALCLARTVPFGTDLHKAVCSIKLCFLGGEMGYRLTEQRIPERADFKVVTSLNHMYRCYQETLPQPAPILGEASPSGLGIPRSSAIMIGSAMPDRRPPRRAPAPPQLVSPLALHSASAPDPTIAPIARWVPDDARASCHACRKDFSFFRRKHHCRLCGEIFCADCTTGKVATDFRGRLNRPDADRDEAGPWRVCDACVGPAARRAF